MYMYWLTHTHIHTHTHTHTHKARHPYHTHTRVSMVTTLPHVGQCDLWCEVKRRRQRTHLDMTYIGLLHLLSPWLLNLCYNHHGYRPHCHNHHGNRAHHNNHHGYRPHCHNHHGNRSHHNNHHGYRPQCHNFHCDSIMMSVVYSRITIKSEMKNVHV